METFTKKTLRFSGNFIWFLDYFFNHPSKNPPKNIKRILVIELDKIGDILMTTPTIRALSLFYHVKVDVMVQPAMQEVLLHNPYIHRILPYGRTEIKENYTEILEKLKGNYDLGVLLHPGSKILGKLLRDMQVQYRVGVTRPGFFDGKGYYLHKKNKPNFSVYHKTKDNLDVIETTLGIPSSHDHYELFISKEHEMFVERLLRSEHVKQPFILIHAAPAFLSHQWDSEKFAKLADLLIAEGYAIIFSGSQKDIAINDEILKHMEKDACNLAGTTRMQQFFSLVRKSKLVISVDTSAMHVAAALHVPVVALFGEGNPTVWRPYPHNCRVIFKERGKCKACKRWFHADSVKHECMDLIQVEEVMEAVQSLLSLRFRE